MKHLVTCLKFSSLLTTYSKKERKKEKHQNCCFECPWRSPTPRFPRLQLSLIRKSKSLFNLSDAFDTDLPILLRQVQTTFGTLGTVLFWTENTYICGRCSWGILRDLYNMDYSFTVPTNPVWHPSYPSMAVIIPSTFMTQNWLTVDYLGTTFLPWMSDTVMTHTCMQLPSFT